MFRTDYMTAKWQPNEYFTRTPFVLPDTWVTVTIVDDQGEFDAVLACPREYADAICRMQNRKRKKK